MVTDKRIFEFQWRDRFYCYTRNDRAERSVFSLFSSGEIILLVPNVFSNGEVGKSNTIFQFSLLNIIYLPLPYSLFHFAYYIATRLPSFLWIKQLHIGRKNVVDLLTVAEFVELAMEND